MFTLFTRQYVRSLTVNEKPTKESLNEAFRTYEAESVFDKFITWTCHNQMLKKLRQGTLKGGRRYEITATVQFPMMFWHKIHYKIVCH